jgi:hypothetical protein
MKKVYLFFAITLLNVYGVFSQTQVADTSWKKGGLIGINFNQASLSNWAQGGENSVAISSTAFLFANYAKNKTEWSNRLDLAYAMVQTGNDKLKKSDDKIEFNSKYGHKLSDKWLVSFLLNFKSQFADGYIYPDDSTIVSKFFSPAYLTLGIGFTYKPVNFFEVFISPATAKLTFVNDSYLSSIGAYGVDSGKTVRTEMGAYINMIFKKDIMENVTLASKLELFDNYTDKDAANAKKIDVNWDVLLNMKINSALSANINTQLIYDANVIERTQFKETLGIGLNYKF